MQLLKVFSIDQISIKSLIFLFIAFQVKGQNMLHGEYFSGEDFDVKVMVRDDANINFKWDEFNPPNRQIKWDKYSARWTGYIYSETKGIYTFSALVDDGIRVWVGGKKIIDHWDMNDSVGFTGSVYLDEYKKYTIKVEYFNGMREGEIHLMWKMPNEKEAKLIEAKYFKPIPIPPQIKEIPTKEIPKKVETMPIVKTPIKVNPPAVKERVQPIVKENIEPAKVNLTIVEEKKVVPIQSKIETNKSFVFKNVEFAQSSYKLLPESYAELDDLAKYLSENPNLFITISGHTDNVGDERLNVILSEMRAKAVRQYLINNGINANNIEAEGFGGSKPLTNNKNETERKQNRRVEFMLK